MKSILIFFFILFPCYTSSGQGLEFTPDSKYDSIIAPVQYGAAEIDKSYVIPRKYLPIPKNQGSQLSCVGFAVGYGFMSSFMAIKNDWVIENDNRTYSPSYIYQKVKSCNDCGCGASIDLALERLAREGIVPFNIYPYKEINCNLPPPPEFDNLQLEAKNHKIGQYYSLEKSNFFEIKQRLEGNMPIIAGVFMLPNFHRLGKKNESFVYKKNTYGIKDNPNKIKHAILIVGYHDGLKAFKIMNSYGTEWVSKGYCWVSYDSFKHMLQQAFYVSKDNSNAPPLILSSVSTPNLDFGASANVITPNDSLFSSSIEEPSAKIDSSKNDKHGNKYIDSMAGKVPFIKNKKYATVPLSQSAKKADLKVKLDSLGNYNIDASKDFEFFGRKEVIRDGRYYFSFGIVTSSEILSHIKKVVYVYDHPSFINKHSTSLKSPHFINSYEGSICLDSMSAIIYFDNSTSLTIPFNGCELANKSFAMVEHELMSFDIQPYVTAEGTSKKKTFNFKIELRGIEPIKDKVSSVVYYWNHNTFKNKITIVTNRSNNFNGGYTGWGCLTDLNIEINFVGGKKKEINVNMCQQLGW